MKAKWYHLLPFGIGQFAFAKDQASSSLDGLLKENPTPCSNDLSGLNDLFWNTVVRVLVSAESGCAGRKLSHSFHKSFSGFIKNVKIRKKLCVFFRSI